MDSVSASTEALSSEILSLKKAAGAYVMAHNYQSREIQEIADFTGDSLAMAQEAARTSAEILVVCGVYFMAETAKILNPEKRVLLPDLQAGCPLADFADPGKVREWRDRYPDHAFVTYVNSSAAVKALSDVCCTSSNALKIVESLESERIVFLPDRNLGSFVAENTGKEVILWPGCCPVHDGMTPQAVQEVKATLSDRRSMALVHPECTQEVRQEADSICSTGQMFSVVESHPDVKDFIIVTEGNMIHALQRQFPDHRFYEPQRKIHCRNMARITLEKLRDCLKEDRFSVEVDTGVSRAAVGSIRKMLELS